MDTMGGDGVDVRQAQQFWNMLEEMSSTNPEAYKSFIKKQLKEGAQTSKMEEPKFKMAFQSTFKNNPKKKLFVNLFEWSKIPAPECDSDLIQVCDGVLVDFEDVQEKKRDEKAKVVSVAFHPEVMRRYTSQAHQQDVLVNLAIDSVEKSNQVQVCRNYVIHEKCCGRNEVALRSLMQRVLNPKPCQEVPDKESNLFKDVIELSKTKRNDIDLSSVDVPLVLKTDDKTTAKSKVFIEEIRQTEKGLIKTPVHKTSVVEREGKRLVVVRIWLPGVESVEKCVLEVSEDDLLLEAGNEYFVVVELPLRVQCASVEASFDGVKSCLTVLMPCHEND